MKSKVQKWGNSNGIRIPKNMLEELNLQTNDTVLVTLEQEKIIIQKVEYNNFANKVLHYEGPNLAKEFIWDEPRGKEIW